MDAAKRGVSPEHLPSLTRHVHHHVHMALKALGGDGVPTVGSVAGRQAKPWRARSRLYRSRSLQVNTHLKALVEIYTIHIFVETSDIKIRYFFKTTEFVSLKTFLTVKCGYFS